MPYTDYTKVRGFFKGITVDDVTNAEITAIIAERSDPWTNGKMRRMFVVPFSPVPEEITLLSGLVAAAWTCFTAYAYAGTHWDAMKGYWSACWDQANGLVKDIHAGVIVLSATEIDTGLVSHNIPSGAKEMVHPTSEEKWGDYFSSVSNSDVANSSEEDE